MRKFLFALCLAAVLGLALPATVSASESVAGAELTEGHWGWGRGHRGGRGWGRGGWHRGGYVVDNSGVVVSNGGYVTDGSYYVVSDGNGGYVHHSYPRGYGCY